MQCSSIQFLTALLNILSKSRILEDFCGIPITQTLLIPIIGLLFTQIPDPGDFFKEIPTSKIYCQSRIPSDFLFKSRIPSNFSSRSRIPSNIEPSPNNKPGIIKPSGLITVLAYTGVIFEYMNESQIIYQLNEELTPKMEVT